MALLIVFASDEIFGAKESLPIFIFGKMDLGEYEERVWALSGNISISIGLKTP